MHWVNCRSADKAVEGKLGFVLALSLGVGGLPVLAHSETFENALTKAYLFNPTLKASQAELRAIDETVSQAKSASRPRVNGGYAAGYQNVRTNTKGVGKEMTDYFPRILTLDLTQPLFRGFRTLNAVKGAKADVEASREDLRATEQSVLLDAATAYADVIRDQAILGLRESNVKVLAEEQRSTDQRAQAGEVTRTDVAQARARASGALTDLASARANLQASRAAYRRLVGEDPRDLQAATPPRLLLPPSMGGAITLAESNHPDVLKTIFNEVAAGHKINEITGELLPEANLSASYEKTFDDSNYSGATSEVTTATLGITVPIYQGGEVSARIRQAKQTRSQRRHQIDEAREKVRAEVISAWGNLQSSRAQRQSDQAQVDSTEIALAGVREEERVGQRTLLDVLNSEQERLDAKVSLARTQRNLVVATLTLVAALGRLSAADLGLSLDLYDPTHHYDAVKDKWFGWQTETLTRDKAE